MAWDVMLGNELDAEFGKLPDDVQEKLIAHMKLLEQFGPQLSRPRVDTLNNSKHANMKELRFEADGGVWRTAFAFDPVRKGILLICGDKSGVKEKRFYEKLIALADKRFDAHLERLKEKKDKKK